MSATQKILKALQEGRQLTGLDILFNFNVKRESSVIHRLRERGHPIKTTMVTTDSGKRVARYSYETAKKTESL